MTPHDHRVFVPGCYRCELGRDEAMDALEDLECTHCGGDGQCCDGADPLGNCTDSLHPCHACGGSGKRKDQTIF